LEPRKNLLHLIDAYSLLPETLKEQFPLILGGDIGWHNKNIFKRIENQKKYVRWIGYVKDRSELALLYNAATVFVYPSLYEGFGIPPLEAMACGTPVCLSSIPVFHEVFNSHTAAYFDLSSPEELSDCLRDLLDDESKQRFLAGQGVLLAEKYSWENTSQQYYDLFRKIIV
jgi:glycosyltransferase involved in cell wall biosynthesis